GVSKRLLLSFGFLCYAASLIYFCNLIQADLVFNAFIFPLLLTSIAYAFTLTTAAAFLATNIPRKSNKDRAMGSIYARYILGSFVSYAIYSDWLHRGIQHHSSRVAENISFLNQPFNEQFKLISGAMGLHHTDKH